MDGPAQVGDPVLAGGTIDPARVDPEAFLDPYALLQACRNADGDIVDFVYVAANRAGAAEYDLDPSQMAGRTLLELNPEDRKLGLFDQLVEVVETGESLSLDDWGYPEYGEVRYFDISATRVGDGVGLAWWDVTQRYQRDRAAAVAERELRATLDALLDPHDVLRPVFDDEGRVVDAEYLRVNAASCRYLQRPAEQLVGHRLLQAWPADVAQVVLGWVAQVQRTGEPLSLDAQSVLTPDGVMRQFDVRGVRVGDAVSFTYRDVTARVSAAKQIEESREHFRLLAENASEVVVQTGPEGTITWVSPSVTRVIGWPVAQILGRRMSEFVHPDDVPAVLPAELAQQADDIVWGRVELRMATADGGWRWMSVLGRVLRDEDGRVVGGVDAMRDIQAERDARAALEESEERFRRSMMDAAIGMAIVAPSGALVRVNPAMCELLGRDERTLMNSTWQELTHPDDVADDEHLVRDLLDGKRDTYRLAKRYVRPDGEVVWADLTVSCVRDDADRVRYLVSQIIDITAAVRAREALASSEEHYRLLAENSSDVVFRSSAAGLLEWISPSLTEVLGWKPEQVLGSPILEFLNPDDVPDSIALRPESTALVDFDGRVRTAAGPSLWMDISARPLIDEAGELIGRVGRLRDVQAEHDAQEALRRSEQRFRTAMESAPTGMAVVGLNREFIEVNPALCRLLGRTEQWLLTHAVTDVLDPLDDDLDRRLRAQVLAGLVPSLVRDHQMIRSDGERVLVEQSIGLLRDDQGRATAYVSQFADVTEARETREQLRFMATHDSLTELLNRRELVTRISGVLGRTPRTGINVGVLFIDLDGLKPVNDTYGHAIGDAVIVNVARRIHDQVRSNDVLARFGGDEFVLVLPAIHDSEDAERIAASLHEVVERPMLLEGHEISMTLSIGVTVARPGEDPDVAMRQADAALYRAKREGRARTVVYDAGIDGD